MSITPEINAKMTKAIIAFAKKHDLSVLDTMRSCVMSAGEICFIQCTEEISVVQAMEAIVEIAQEQLQFAREKELSEN